MVPLLGGNFVLKFSIGSSLTAASQRLPLLGGALFRGSASTISIGKSIGGMRLCRFSEAAAIRRCRFGRFTCTYFEVLISNESRITTHMPQLRHNVAEQNLHHEICFIVWLRLCMQSFRPSSILVWLGEQKM